MCPYHDYCKIKHQYAGTDLCQDRYEGCAAYIYAGVKGPEAVPKDMKAIDYALLSKGKELESG